MLSQHRVRLFSCFLCQLAVHKLRERSPTRWDILDVPATKNVELYNPEMDESKPKSEVLSLKHWNLTIIASILREDTCVWSQVDAENDKLLTDITFILTMRRKTLFYTVN